MTTIHYHTIPALPGFCVPFVFTFEERSMFEMVPVLAWHVQTDSPDDGSPRVYVQALTTMGMDEKGIIVNPNGVVTQYEDCVWSSVQEWAAEFGYLPATPRDPAPRGR